MFVHFTVSRWIYVWGGCFSSIMSCHYIFTKIYICVLMDHLPDLLHICVLVQPKFLFELLVTCNSNGIWDEKLGLVTEPLSSQLWSRMTRPGTRMGEWICVLREAGRWWVGAGWGHSYCLGCHGWATPEPLGGPKGPRGQATAMSPRAPRPWEPHLWSMSAVSLGTLGATDWAIWSREQRPWHTAVTRGRHAETWT